MAGTTSTAQGSRPVHGAIALSTPLGDSAMDETNDAVRVNVVAGAGSGGTASTDDAAFAVASGSGTPIMGLADETSPDSVDEGDVGVVRMTLPRALHVNLRDSSGTEITSFGGGTEYAEDTASTAADKVTMAGVVRKDTAATLVDTDGDRTQMQVDATGRLYVNASGVAVPVTDNAGSLTVDNPILSVVGGGTEAAAQRVTIATDSTGVLSVDDNGGNLSIDDGGNSITVDNLVLSVVGGGTEAAAQRVTIATDSTGVLSVDDNGGSLTVDGTVSAVAAGDVAHDGVDSGNPVKIGYTAIAHGTNPTAVAAADRTTAYANRAGIPFMMGGHPNVICREILIAAADGAQTDASIAGTINAGTKVVITKCSAMASAANTVNTPVRVGFGASTLPTAATAGVNGVVLKHANLAPGSGVVEGNGSGIIGIGADGEEVRLTCGAPTSGHLSILITFYTIES